MAEVKRFSLAKPTIQTPYHIDFDWWSQNERNWRIHLLNYLSPDHRQAFSEGHNHDLFDVIDAQTAEVRQVDGLRYLLMSVYAQQAGFITESSSLVESIFRLLLANGNQPMTPFEIGAHLNRPAETILQMLSGKQIYRGLRPYWEPN